ncbi:MAG: DUF1761 domain-containing protein [SAR202 cluster bacterium]|nr:DUF1761 domain-containing protein [SAR202 cluster bacterium]
MTFDEAIASVHYLAVLAASSAFLVGGLWYSLLFAKPWMNANRLTPSDLRGGTVAVFAGSFVLALVIAYVLVLFLGPDRDAAFGATAGFMTGAFWVAAAFGITYLFERRPWRLLAIDAGYHVVAFTLMGLILGAWR